MADGGVVLEFPRSRTRALHMSKRDVRLASYSLVRKHPLWSCYSKARHRSGLIVFAVIAGCLGLFQPLLFLGIANILGVTMFTVLIAMRAALVLRGALERGGRVCATHEAPLTDSDHEAWPRYSVLVPLYKEAGSVLKLVSGLKALDYPQDKLEVLFLVEREDRETLQALELARLPFHWPILILPEGQPRTKPRALNVALSQITGQIVTIYDAEDHPHPGQLKAAVTALRAGGESMACVQAPLRAYNHRSSWLAGQWALEYDIHFGLVLPALAKADRPIALGGTSNHFRVNALRAAGGWDAWNVTEDADLGLRFARLGYTIGTLDLATLEEAPETLSVWVPQRSRWIKGYMQSAGVILRQPVRAMAQMGVSSFIASQILLSGAILSACLHGPFALICMIYLMVPGMSLAPTFIWLVIAGYGVNVAAALLAPGPKDFRRLWLVLTAPLYWPLQSLAAMRALWELATDPHMWSKTPHGLTEFDVPDQSLTHVLRPS